MNAPDRGGYGLDAAWNDDFHHSIHALLTGENAGYYTDFGRPAQLAKALNETFVYDGCYSDYRGRRHGTPVGDHAGDRFVVSIQTHDQVGNRARGDRFGTLLSPAQQRLAAGLMLLAPHLPLLFMGEEYGETQPFAFFCSFEDRKLINAVRRGRRAEIAAFGWPENPPDPQSEATFEAAKLTWLWPEDSWHAGLRRLYHDLLVARKTWPAMQDFKNRSAELADADDSTVLCLTRSGDPSGGVARLITYFNLSSQEQALPADDRGDAVLLLSSELVRYTGKTGDAPDTPAPPVHAGPAPFLLPFEFSVFGPDSWRLP